MDDNTKSTIKYALIGGASALALWFLLNHKPVQNLIQNPQSVTITTYNNGQTQVKPSKNSVRHKKIVKAESVDEYIDEAPVYYIRAPQREVVFVRDVPMYNSMPLICMNGGYFYASNCGVSIGVDFSTPYRYGGYGFEHGFQGHGRHFGGRRH
jgi:hypothetical protein